MRWDALFEDLEAQWSAQQAQRLEADVAEALELEQSRTHLADRLRAAAGCELRLNLPGEPQLRVRVDRVGADWLGGHSGVQSLLIPLQAIHSVDGLPQRSQPETSRARKRLSIGSPLRALARSREVVNVQDPGGQLGRGLITRVGADHFDLALASGDQAPGRSQPQLRSVPLAAVVAVRSGLHPSP